MAVFDQNSFFRIPLERFANFHKIAGSSQNDLALPSSRRARRAESIGTNVVAWRRIDPFFRPKTLSLRAIGLNTHQHIIGPRRGTENKTGKRSSFRGGAWANAESVMRAILIRTVGSAYFDQSWPFSGSFGAETGSALRNQTA